MCIRDRVKEVKVKLGDKLNIGDLLAIVQGQSDAAAPAAAAPSPAPAAASAPAAAASSTPAPAAAAPAAAKVPAHDPTVAPSSKLPLASPSVRKFARELGVPLDEVKGTATKGRITQDDVTHFTKAVMAGTAQTKAAAAKAPAASGGVSGGGELNLLPWPCLLYTSPSPRD